MIARDKIWLCAAALLPVACISAAQGVVMQ
jgi:hypothetical protein